MKQLITIIVIGVMVTVPVMATDFGPFSADPRHPPFKSKEPDSRLEKKTDHQTASLFIFAFKFWSDLLTKIDGPRCSHRPSCSVYAHRALARYKLPLGFWMAINRVMRGAESSVLASLPLVALPAGVFFLDRIEDNTFWCPGYLPMSGR